VSELQAHPQVSRAFGTELVPIDSVQPHPENYREHDVGAISASLERFGQTKPIIVQGIPPRLNGGIYGYIIAGSGTWKAAKALGWTEIGVRFMEWDDLQAKAYMIADNRLHDLGRTEEDALAELLSQLAQDDALEGTGFDGDDVDDLLVETGKLELPKTPRGKPRTVACPECGHKFDPRGEPR
jgi:ParB-like chromosome segregation protein Spo0J